jgi:hypothetical protein
MVVKGTGAAQALAPTGRWTKASGYVTVYQWEGPTKESILGLIPGLQEDGYTEISWDRPDGIKWRLQASRPTQPEGTEPEIVDTWEFIPSIHSEDIVNHRNCWPSNPDSDDMEVSPVPESQLQRILEWMNSPSTSALPALTASSAIDLFDLMVRGVRTFIKPDIALRRTRIASNLSDVNAAYSHFGKVWTFNRMPSDAMPAATLQVFNSLSNANPYGDQFGHTWGWLKMFPGVITDFSGRTQLTEDWWLGLWNTRFQYVAHS